MIRKTSLNYSYTILVVLFITINVNKIINTNSNHGQEKSYYIDNPYSEVDWEESIYLDSMSHQHANTSSIKRLIDMRYDHFLISNYYPSKPLYPLPTNLENDQELISGPNAEHHTLSDLDFSYHFTALGSRFVTGYGRNFLDEIVNERREFTIKDLNIFDADLKTPGEGVYRLDVRSIQKISDTNTNLDVRLSGVTEVNRRTFEEINNENIISRSFYGGEAHTFYFKVNNDSININIEYDISLIEITQFRIMQGSNRPWRQLFSQLLDGDYEEDGESLEGRMGLLYEDSGGIVINHPSSEEIDNYLEMLDYDDRVLGIEVWNHRRLFGLKDEEPHNQYYENWDKILTTGRRCFGFFVKDHRLNGLGRNVLIVPDTTGLSIHQKENIALSAYRNGQFFGRLGAPAIDDNNNLSMPFDYSEFKFESIRVDSSIEKNKISIIVEIDDNDAIERPNTQIRFITNEGISKIVNNANLGIFTVNLDQKNLPEYNYVRVEALAYPKTYNNGDILSEELVNNLDVYELIRLHNMRAIKGDFGYDIDETGKEPISIVDMIFSQPIRFVLD